MDPVSRFMKGLGKAGAIGGFIPVVIFASIAAAVAGSIWPLAISVGGYTALAVWLLRDPPPPAPVKPIPPRRENFQDNAVWTPARHFDLMLRAKHEIGRVRGAAHAIGDARTAAAFDSFARRADGIVDRLVAEPLRLGFGRELLASHLPRAADLAEGAHAIRGNLPEDIIRRAKLTDLVERLASAIERSEQEMVAPELLRLDADLDLLTEDLRMRGPRADAIAALPAPSSSPMPSPFARPSEQTASKVQQPR